MLKLSRNAILTGVAVLAILITGVLIYANQNPGAIPFLQLGLSNDVLAKKGIDYLNTNVLSGGSEATLVSVSEESGLVKIKLKIGESEYDSYITKDGRLLFPQAFTMEIAEKNQQNNETASAQTCESLPKSDKPMLEAYVVSMCPFGIQMQRMMAEAIKAAPELADYVFVRYIGALSADGKTITSMHGEDEAKENLRQICIRDEQKSKYWKYMSCYMKAGKASDCQKSAGIDSAKLNGCISDSNRGVAYAKEDFDLASQYGASGSPTLVLGGTTVEEFDSSGSPNFGGRSADEIRQVVCCGANSQPSFCSKKLTTEQAAASFSETYLSPNSSENSAANCQ